MSGALSAISLTADPSLFWAGALVGALGYAVRSARRSNLDPRATYWAGVAALFFGLWGGHLLGMYYYGSDGRPFAWLRFWSGGQAQYGGLIAGALAVIVYLKLRRAAILRYADAAVPAVALGVAIGRIGCFVNGDDFGTRSTLPWAVAFPPGTEAYADHFNRGWISLSDPLSLRVHPVQLYASLFALALFVLLVWWRPRVQGARLALFLAVYGAGRFAEQLFRGDFRPSYGPFSLTQVISLVLIAAGASWLIYLRRPARAAVRDNDHGALLSSATVRN